jgi:hypothetical protein
MMQKLVLALFFICVSVHNAFKLGSKFGIRRRFLSPFSDRDSTKLRLTLQEVEGVSEAFVGGTVGVMSVAFILELRKLNQKNLEGCPYCMGNGEILCAMCLGSGTASAVAGGAACECGCCAGRGLVMCINCKGDGRETPILLISRAVRNPVRVLCTYTVPQTIHTYTDLYIPLHTYTYLYIPIYTYIFLYTNTLFSSLPYIHRNTQRILLESIAPSVLVSIRYA